MTGIYVLDTIANVGTPARLEAAKANAVEAYCRYVSPTSRLNKQALYDEVQAILNAGLGFIPNFEISGAEWRGGYARGRSDGAWAREWVSGTGRMIVNGRSERSLGLPATVQIPQSTDTSVSSSELPTLHAYQRGYNETANGIQVAYGPGSAVQSLFDAGLITHGWQWKDGSRPTVPAAALRQRYDTPLELGYSYDLNHIVRRPFGAYYLDAPPPPLPPYNPAAHQYSLWPLVGSFGTAPKPDLRYGDGYAVAHEKRPAITYFNDVCYYEAGQPTRDANPMFVFTEASVNAVRNLHNFFDPNNQNPALDAEAWYGVCGQETWKLIDAMALHFGQPR